MFQTLKYQIGVTGKKSLWWRSNLLALKAISIKFIIFKFVNKKGLVFFLVNQRQNVNVCNQHFNNISSLETQIKDLSINLRLYRYSIPNC